MFTPVGSLLKTLPRRSKISEAMMALFVRRAFSEVLREVCADLSDKVLGNVRAVSFKNGVLTIRSPLLVSTELQMRSGGLIRAVNKVIGRQVVSRLRFRIN